MAGSEQQRASLEAIVRWTARALAFLILGFWLWFAVGELLFFLPKEGWAGARIHLIQAVIILLMLALVWFFDLAAGVGFIALAGLSFYAWGRNIFVALALCLPFTVLGLLFIAAWILGRRRMLTAPLALEIDPPDSPTSNGPDPE